MSTEHPVAEGEHGPADDGRPNGWVVWRQDDNGNRFEVARKDSREDAEQLAAVMEARGHKQLYWVAKGLSRPHEASGGACPRRDARGLMRA